MAPRPTRMAQCCIQQSTSCYKRVYGRGSQLSAAAGVEGRGTREVTDILETDEARHLIDVAQAAGGSLSADEIALGLDELDLDAGQIDEFYRALEELQIEVVVVVGVEDAPEKEIVAEPREVSTDSLQLFLK